MNKRGVKKKLTKSDILDKVSQVDIFSFYLSKFNQEFTVKTIEYLADTGARISNPMRYDEDPSMGFRYVGKGKLKARDFAGYFWGDCFDLVAHILKVNANTKVGFILVLKKIANDLCVSSIDISETEKEQLSIPFSIKKVRNRVYQIQPIIRDWNESDGEYWGNRGISVLTLNTFYVYPVLSYSVLTEDGLKHKYEYDPANPCYAYYNGKDTNGIDKWDLYFPKHSKGMPKFIKSHNSLGGLLTYNKDADILMIIKSLKDAMSVHELVTIYFSMYTVTYVIPMSESTPINEKQLTFIVNNHSKTYVLYDFDRVGIMNSNRIRRAYPVTQLFFTNGRFGSYNYGHKDYTDYYDAKGKRSILTIVKEVINEFKTEQSSMEESTAF